MIWLLCSDAVDISSLSVALITFVVCSHVMDILMCDYSIYQSPVYLCVVHYKRILHVSFVYECVFLIDHTHADLFLFAGVPLRCIMQGFIAKCFPAYLIGDFAWVSSAFHRDLSFYVCYPSCPLWFALIVHFRWWLSWVVCWPVTEVLYDADTWT